MKRTLLCLAPLMALVAGCSGESREEQELAQIEAARAQEQMRETAEEEAAPGGSVEARYQRAVECAATHMGVGNLYTAIASADADASPDRAAEMRSTAQERFRTARQFGDIAIEIGAAPEIGKTREQVIQDIGAADQAIGARGTAAADFTAFGVELGREADRCAGEQAQIGGS